MMNISVAIPCYKVKKHVLGVIEKIPKEVVKIYAVDDCCPHGSGKFIEENCKDPRVQVIYHSENQGVGGAVTSAYRQALNDKMDIVVKIDGDGQMNPELLSKFVLPIENGLADYTKGNRFYRPESLKGMPLIRMLGNAGLSFLTKVSSGYWSIMDPTNGYTAVHCAALRRLPLDKLEKRFYFESDMLFRLNTIRAVVRDIPMDSVYADEESNFKAGQMVGEFGKKIIARSFRRYFYKYILRDFNIGSVYSILGVILIFFGVAFGALSWLVNSSFGNQTSSGTVMISALPIILGFQMFIAFLHFDVSDVPVEPLLKEDDGNHHPMIG